MRYLIKNTVLITLGFLAGGYLFSSSQPRSFLAIPNCEGRCARPNELAGLLASAGILKLPAAIPGVIADSRDCFAIRHPRPEGREHFVLFPKQDIRNIADLTPDDQPFVIGCLALAGELIRAHKLVNYRLHTNGPGLQHIAYLHFHIVAD
jgi:hypothetical protein